MKGIVMVLIVCLLGCGCAMRQGPSGRAFLCADVGAVVKPKPAGFWGTAYADVKAHPWITLGVLTAAGVGYMIYENNDGFRSDEKPPAAVPGHDNVNVYVIDSTSTRIEVNLKTEEAAE